MINVNQKFIDSCNSDVVASQYKIKVSVNKSGTVLCVLNDDEFDISTGGIQRQASSGSACNIGGVCSTRLKITLNQKGIDKLSSVDGFKKNYVLHLIQWNKVDDTYQSTSDYSLNLDNTENQTGKCDLGFYYISEIDNNYYNCNITAYDGMIAFERNFTMSQLKYLRDNKKSINDWLDYLCGLVSNANINISYTISDITINDGITFNLSEDSSFDTIRDAISQLAMLKMAYATIDIEGNLTLKRGIQTDISTYSDTVDNEYMFSCDNDVVESVVGYFYTSIAGFEYENTYTDQEGRNVINLYLAENKFLRGNEPYNGTGLTSTTLTCLRNMSTAIMGYSFFSCDCEINARPYLELGDVVQIERKFVDSQGQATIQQIPCVIDSVDNQIGATTHLTSNSTVSTNSSSSSKGMNSATPAVNSSPKEPSSSDVYNDINTELTSPVTTYSDTTASIRIRVDDNTASAFDTKACLDYLMSHYTPTLSAVGNGTVTNISDADAIYHKKANKYYDESKYIYNDEFKYSTINDLQTKVKVTVQKKSLDSLIGKQVPFYDFPYVYPSIGTIKDVVSDVGYYNVWGKTTKNTSLVSDLGELSVYDGSTSKAETAIFNELASSDNAIHKQTYTGTMNSSTATSFINTIKAQSGYTVGVKTSNPTLAFDSYVTDWQILCKYMLFAKIYINGGQHITFKVEKEIQGEIVEDTITTDDIIRALSNFNTSITDEEYATTYVNPYISDLKAVFKALAECNYFKFESYYVESTYLTASNPISEADKTKVDDEIVTQDDVDKAVEDVSERVSMLEAQMQDVSDAIDDLREDVSDTNTNLNNLSNDVEQIDNRVDTLENSRDIGDLENVEITSPQNGQVLGYNSTTGKWENQTSGGGGGGSTTLAGLNDVNISNPQAGDGLVYDSQTGKWVNQAGGGGGTTVVANPTGQASADLQKLQVGSTIYAIPSTSELILTSTVARTITNTDQIFICDAKVFDSGDAFITYDLSTGIFEVSEDCFVDIECWINPQSSGSNWVYIGIAESDSIPTADDYWIAKIVYSGHSCPAANMPIVRLKQGKKYAIMISKSNTGTWNTGATSVSTHNTGDYYLNNFVKFTKKLGTMYQPS